MFRSEWRVVCRAFCLAAMAWGATDSSLAATPVACWLSCAGAGCSVAGGGGKPPDLNASTFTRVENCEQYAVGDGKVLLRYRHDRKWFQPPGLDKDKKLAEVFDKFKPDRPCTIPTPECLQSRMSEKNTSTAGHGVDSQMAAPAGTNNPCTLGLPCGMVLPPAGDWPFRVANESFSGRLQIRITRGAPPAGVPAEFDSTVATGAVKVDGRRLSPGGVYAYRLFDAASKEIASGEFSVMSLSDVERLKRLAAKRVERDGMSERGAWIDALAASDLDWDVNQALQDR